jgi:hypothetical protein
LNKKNKKFLSSKITELFTSLLTGGNNPEKYLLVILENKNFVQFSKTFDLFNYFFTSGNYLNNS